VPHLEEGGILIVVIGMVTLYWYGFTNKLQSSPTLTWLPWTKSSLHHLKSCHSVLHASRNVHTLKVQTGLLWCAGSIFPVSSELVPKLLDIWACMVQNFSAGDAIPVHECGKRNMWQRAQSALIGTLYPKGQLSSDRKWTLLLWLLH
jgi:hypothetical protein